MKLVTYVEGGERRAGLVVNGFVFDLERASSPPLAGYGTEEMKPLPPSSDKFSRTETKRLRNAISSNRIFLTSRRMNIPRGFASLWRRQNWLLLSRTPRSSSASE